MIKKHKNKGGPYVGHGVALLLWVLRLPFRVHAQKHSLDEIRELYRVSKTNKQTKLLFFRSPVAVRLSISTKLCTYT